MHSPSVLHQASTPQLLNLAPLLTCPHSNQELQRTYEDPSVEVPKPPHWGGYLVRPTAIEFWQGRPSRLHDRLRFSREGTDGEWSMKRLYP